MQRVDHPVEDGFPAGQGTVLLAEDDPHVRSIAVRVLGRNGFRVITASDGEEAESLIAEHHHEIRLAVLDILMPRRNGRQVHDYLKAHHPEIRVLFCSGYTAEMLPPGTAPDPGYALLNKPYSSRDLLTVVHRLLKE
jgi:DNA-binding NtrC family response regulator